MQWFKDLINIMFCTWKIESPEVTHGHCDDVPHLRLSILKKITKTAKIQLKTYFIKEQEKNEIISINFNYQTINNDFQEFSLRNI